MCCFHQYPCLRNTTGFAATPVSAQVNSENFEQTDNERATVGSFPGVLVTIRWYAKWRGRVSIGSSCRVADGHDWQRRVSHDRLQQVSKIDSSSSSNITVHEPAGFHCPGSEGVCIGVGRSSIKPARHDAPPFKSLPLAMLPPYPESSFKDAISASALSEV